jgi:hypothetical protein
MRIETKPRRTYKSRLAHRCRLKGIDSAPWTAAALSAFTAIMLACATAVAQTVGPDAPPSAPPSVQGAPPAQSEPRGAFDAFGNWVQQGVANVGAGFGAMVGTVGGQAVKDATEAARNAATSVSRLPVTGLTAGRERCVLAPNGAPDCRIAAQALCRSQGYAGGASVDFVTVENCPPPYRVSRRDAPEGICTLEHFVTKALCQ